MLSVTEEDVTDRKSRVIRYRVHADDFRRVEERERAWGLLVREFIRFRLLFAEATRVADVERRLKTLVQEGERRSTLRDRSRRTEL